MKPCCILICFWAFHLPFGKAADSSFLELKGPTKTKRKNQDNDTCIVTFVDDLRDSYIVFWVYTRCNNPSSLCFPHFWRPIPCSLLVSFFFSNALWWSLRCLWKGREVMLGHSGSTGLWFTPPPPPCLFCLLSWNVKIQDFFYAILAMYPRLSIQMSMNIRRVIRMQRNGA